MQDCKCCEITIDKGIAVFWVTIAIILAAVKLAIVPAISWGWVILALLMPLLIVAGVIVLMTIAVGAQWAGQNIHVQMKSHVYQLKSYWQRRHTGEDTSSR